MRAKVIVWVGVIVNVSFCSTVCVSCLYVIMIGVGAKVD